jgi:hypothetical protein
MKYDIPDDFDCSHYKTRYSLTQPDIYSYYSTHKEEQPLDDTYYRIKYAIPADFNTSIYKKLGKMPTSKSASDLDCYIYYASTSDVLDEQYWKLFYDIPASFNAKWHQLIFKSELTNDLNVFAHYAKNIKTTTKSTPTIGDSNIIQLINNDKMFMYVNSFIEKRILLKNLYDAFMRTTPDDIGSVLFMEYYEYLMGFSNFIQSEEQLRYYFFIKIFSKNYLINQSIKYVNETDYSYKQVGQIKQVPALTSFSNPEPTDLDNYSAIYSKITKNNKIYDMFVRKDEIIKNFESSIMTKQHHIDLEVCFFIYDDFHHTFLTLLNNLTIIPWVCNLSICVKKSIVKSANYSLYINNVLSLNIQNVNVYYINEEFTCNDYNNTFYSLNFYNTFNTKYVMFMTSNIVLSQDFVDCQDVSSVEYNIHFSVKDVLYIKSLLINGSSENNDNCFITENYGEIHDNLRNSLNCEKPLQNYYFSQNKPTYTINKFIAL